VPEQSWRNPRPAPQLPEMQPRIGGLLIPSWLNAWWPALVWAGVIFTMSTDTFSAEHTASIFEPIFRWLIPTLTEDQFDVIHHYIRKSAHFTEYFVFCLFLYRGVRAGRTGWRWSWGLTALFIAAAYSALDEIHQAFVVSRTASPYDSLLDSAGAFVATAALYLWFRRRKPSPPAQPAPDATPSS
jgi:VanZ family protein